MILGTLYMSVRTPVRTMMLVTRRILDVGHSKAVVIPRAWLDGLKRASGKRIEEVEVSEYGTSSLMITPILPPGVERALENFNLVGEAMQRSVDAVEVIAEATSKQSKAVRKLARKLRKAKSRVPK